MRKFAIRNSKILTEAVVVAKRAIFSSNNDHSGDIK